MLNALLCILIIAIIGAGAFYAAHYIVKLRHHRDLLADDYQRAVDHIKQLEEAIQQMQFEREQLVRTQKIDPNPVTGYDAFQVRG